MSLDSVACSELAARPSVPIAAIARLVRAVYILLGIGLAILGLASIVLPFISTITTLLASSFFLNRSLPQLQNLMKALPLIGKFIKYLDGTRIMTSRARFRIITYLWVNMLVSCASLYGIGLVSTPIVSINILCCVISTGFILTYPTQIKNVTKAKSVDTSIAANSELGEIPLLECVQSMTREINESLGGLPHATAQASE
jgi:uncharacterized membrane protein YbaN (DUF454 family)